MNFQGLLSCLRLGDSVFPTAMAGSGIELLAGVINKGGCHGCFHLTEQ